MAFVHLPEVQVSSVEQLDDVLQSNRSFDSTYGGFGALEKRVIQESYTLQRLLILKCIYGRHPATEAMFRAHRVSGTHAPPFTFLEGYHKAFGALNASAGAIFGGGRVKRFLDLGCSPGGFSEWLLGKNDSATGIGITLSDEEASWPMHIGGTCLDGPRYTLQLEDIVKLVLDSITQGALPYISEASQADIGSQEIPHERFDLVIAGAFPTMQRMTLFCQRAQLVLGQILVVLTNIADGGHAVVVINTKAVRWIIETVALLRRCFEQVIAAKGAKLHRQRSSCYLLCTGFCASAEEREATIKQLRDAMLSLESMIANSGRARWARQRAGTEGDRGKDCCEGAEEADAGSDETSEYSDPKTTFRLLNMNDDELFDAEHRFFLDTLEPIWQLQDKAIYDTFTKNLREAAQDDETHTLDPRGQTSKPQPAPLKVEGVDWRAPGLPSPVSPFSQPFFQRRSEPTFVATGPPVTSTSWRRQNDEDSMEKSRSRVLNSGLFSRQRGSDLSHFKKAWGSRN